MSKSKLMFKSKRRSLFAASVASAAFAASTGAQAAVSVQQYSPAANSTYTMTEDAMLEVAPKDPTWTGRRFFFSANYNWLNDALIQYDETRTTRTATLVDGVQTLDLGIGVFLDRNLSVGLSTPLNVVRLSTQGSRFAFGDTRVFGKIRVTDDDALLHVSLMPGLWLPTGDSSLFTTDGSAGFGGLVAIERDFGPVRASANIGYRYTADARFEDINYSQRLPMALGVFIPVDRKWGINAEAAGALTIPVNSFNNPGEIYAGARYQFNRDATVLGGVSLGSINSQAGNDLRVSVGIRFSPMPEPKVVEAPRPVPAPVVAKAPVTVPAKPRVFFTRKEIRLTEEIKFEHDKAVLTPSGRHLLDEVAAVMKKNRKSFKKILVIGHTNELGTHPYNQKLSDQRAATVREYLASRGIPMKDLLSVGHGKTKPKRIKGLPREAALAANRRVEFQVLN